MKQIPTQSENPFGLYQRYQVKKWVKKYGGKNSIPFGKSGNEMKAANTDPDAEYFVMRLDEGGKDPEHIKACRVGVNAYADAIRHHLPDLAKDLKERYPLL